MPKVTPLQPNEILFEDNHLLVINKRAGLVTQGAAAGQTSLIELAKDYVRRKYNKPGNVYLGIVSRLDALTSGAIVVARTSKAAARLTQQFKDRKTKKLYWAIVEDTDSGDSIGTNGHFESWMFKDEKAKRMRSVSESQKDSIRAAATAKNAKLSWRQIGVNNHFKLLEVELQTGRKHQIRCQFAAKGFPILGDRKYGSATSFAGPGIALHSKSIEITHPIGKNVIQFDAKLPDCWKIARYNL